jgi:hypothetical protein
LDIVDGRVLEVVSMEQGKEGWLVGLGPVSLLPQQPRMKEEQVLK